MKKFHKNMVPKHVRIHYIDSWLSRCSTARGSSTKLFHVGPTKVKAHKSFLFTGGSLKVENEKQLVDFVVTLFSSLVNYFVLHF